MIFKRNNARFRAKGYTSEDRIKQCNQNILGVHYYCEPGIGDKPGLGWAERKS